jgi:phosphoribosylglycinamide formyltransferase-1
VKLAVLVSGTGSNLQALLDAERNGTLAPGEIVCVVSNRPVVRALERAAQAGKPAQVVDHTQFASREAFEDAVQEVLAAHEVEGIVLAGFMRMLTPRFLLRYPDRIINVHPSLLPAFPGVNAQKQALEYGVRVTGATVHFVSPEMDGGAIILQAAVPVFEDDTVDEVNGRILIEEHWILPRATQLLAAGKLVREGRRVKIR